MPHIIVKLWPGQSEEEKARLSEQIVQDVMTTFGHKAESISLGFEEITPGDWAETVYELDIKSKWDTLTKKPGTPCIEAQYKEREKRHGH